MPEYWKQSTSKNSSSTPSPLPSPCSENMALHEDMTEKEKVPLPLAEESQNARPDVMLETILSEGVIRP